MEEIMQLIQGAMDQLAQAQELLAGGGQAQQAPVQQAGPDLQAILAQQGGQER